MKQLPAAAGISLKPEHYIEILERTPAIAWFEVHPENYMCAGGNQHRYLEAIRAQYALSMHGVGASLGSEYGCPSDHLEAWLGLEKAYEPSEVSEHLAWSRWEHSYSNDLLPVPYTKEALSVFCANIERMQDSLQRRILIENPSVYLSFAEADYSEGQFITEAIEKTGCGLLLDVNNIVVSSHNINCEQDELLLDYPFDKVAEIHLAGHTTSKLDNGETILLDNHGSAVDDAVWALYERLLGRIGKAVPTLIEWDTDIPELDVLIGEAAKADRLLQALNNTEAAQ